MARPAPPQSALNWVVVGQGAIGLLAASRMQLSGVPVSLRLRHNTALKIDFIQPQQTQQLHFPAATAPLNAVLLPVKSYAVIEAVTELLPQLSPNAQLVLSHNGMGTIAQVLRLIGKQQGLWFLTTTHAALRREHDVSHTGIGQSVLAPLNVAARIWQEKVQHAMDKALGPLVVVDDIQPYLWQKLAINAVINPLTAIYNCRNGELAKPCHQQQISQLLQEVCAVSAACGQALEYQATLDKVQQVITATAQNFSSMRQDIAHRRRTEIEAINGYVVQQAARFNLAVPYNSALLLQVQQLEQRG
ncbi:MAG: 2-dehydropantoate 2-reductase [Gammaproteobacteria bacterium]|nr:2-dehydropantoate 2-reductase [Gammaproteobacteria bacterium]MBU1557046.1 2-dehydropantoate 2-reductase [Gammaproteobacteria bacterium]MBU2069836.1 2-dehydropantoate 2-reductase [Gammaproteobacteria bacterium]MBU2184882.1 2-dehydropantoate 2-reductase [Gammaproteobacteria bacterium]MBU2204418.1 2-dehydropantoate 2-reductase [Gammaproteobacteria bacterium]